jgi:aspartate/methionine/tyrosine aminotransferase
MVKIPSFEVEQWMDRYETTPGVLNIAETCVASLSIQDLTELSRDESGTSVLQFAKKLTYGAIRGTECLRQRVAAQYSKHTSDPLSSESVIITQGAILANFLLFYTLIGPGDHVICVYPTYQQLYSVPESLGAEISPWKLKEENGYIPDTGELEDLVRDNTTVRGPSPEQPTRH